MGKYIDILYTGGYQRNKGKIMKLPDVGENRYYWEKNPNKKFCIPFPWLYAKFHNKENIQKKINEEVWSVFDFFKRDK